MTPPSPDTSYFDDLVADALDSLPPDLVALMDNVEVVVERRANSQITGGLRVRGELLGLYHGIPLTKRSNYDRALPDIIYIFREPIERICRTPDEIKEQVRRTVVHEVAHHFGIEEERLHELGWG